MTANEAREIMIKSEQMAIDNDLEDVFCMIKESAERGDTYIWYYGDLKCNSIEHLKEIGYEVEVISSNNETAYKISWV